MFLVARILVSTIALALHAVSLTACGQQGPLYLPTEAAAAKRATLPETLWRAGSLNTTPAPPADPAPVQAPAVNPAPR